MARQQLNVLNAIDVARIQWYHFNVFLLTGLGLFTAAYDLFSISFVSKLLGRIYYQVEGAGRPGILPHNVSTAVLTAANFGTFFGQIIFGWLGDKLGRKKAYGITLILMVVFSLASGLSFGSSSKGVMATLCFFRFWLGFAVGGVYPLSATIMSEYANRRTRGKYIAAVFAMQGVGFLVAGVVALIVVSAFDQAFKAPSFFDDPIHSTVPQADCVWRIILMFGALPAAFNYFWEMKVPETARYTVLVDRDAKQAAADMSKLLHLDIEAEEEKVKKLAENPKGSFGLFSKEFLKCHGLHLFATSSTWFLLDIAYLSQNLLQTHILATMEWFPLGKRMNAIEEVNKNAKARIFIILCDTIPGLLFSLKYIDYLGRIWVQLIGFFFMTVFMFALAIPYHHWAENPSKADFIILYCLIFFSANFGPTVTTFVLPAEIFPARLRSTCHGISAAAGKAGAIVGAFGFLYAAQPSDHRSVRNSLIILAFINLLGMSFACTFSFLKILPNRLPEPKRRSLEELTGENKEFGDETEEQASSA